MRAHHQLAEFNPVCRRILAEIHFNPSADSDSGLGADEARTLRAGVVALIAGTLLAVILEACLTELLFEDDDDGACVCPEAPNASRCV